MSTSVSCHNPEKKFDTAILLVGLTPVFMVVLPWDFGNEMTPYRGFMRGNSLSATIIEMLFLLIVMRRGFSPTAAVAALPSMTKAGLLMLLTVILWTTSTVAKEPIAAIFGLVKMFMHLMFCMAFYHQFERLTIFDRNKIWLAIGCGVLAYCVLWLSNILIYHPTGDDWLWFVPALTNVRWAGFFALAGFCAGIGSLSSRADGSHSVHRFLIALSFSTVGLSIAFWTGSRGAVLASLAAAIGPSVFVTARRQIILLSLSAAFLGLIIGWALPIVHQVYGIERIIGTLTPANGLAGLSSGRTEVWAETAQQIWQRPITGWGVDQFTYVGPKTALGLKHPHQAFLQLLFSVGTLGALAMLFIIYPFASAVSIAPKQPYQWAGLAYLSGAIAYGLYDGFFYYTFPVMIFLVSIVCIGRTTSPQSVTDRSNSPVLTG